MKSLITLLILSLSLSTFANDNLNDKSQLTFAAASQQFLHPTGLLRGEASRHFLRTAPRAEFTSATSSIPKSFSLRGSAGPVEDQGLQCGSCWDFALTTGLRGTWMSNLTKDPGRLSFNYLLNCATNAGGCQGGDFDAAEFLLSPKGAPAYGADGPYTGTQGTCVGETPVASATSYVLLGSDFGVNPNNPTPFL